MTEKKANELDERKLILKKYLNKLKVERVEKIIALDEKLDLKELDEKIARIERYLRSLDKP